MSSFISPQVSVTAFSPGVPVGAVWRWSVQQYHAMIRTGLLTEEDPVELLDGLLVMKMPKNPLHRSATIIARDSIGALLPPGWSAWSQEPITLSTSEPEPDIVVVRGDWRRYSDRHPGPEDVALVVEVADSTLERDRTFKKRLYAEAGIPEYWIVNLIDRQLEVYSGSSGATAEYRDRRDYLPDARVPLQIETQQIGFLAVRALIP